MQKMKQIEISNALYGTFIKDIGLSYTANIVLRGMSSFIDDNYHGADYIAKVPYKLLSKQTGLGSSTISKAIREIKDAGYVQTKRTQDANVYTFNIPLIMEKHSIWVDYMAKLEEVE